MLGGGIGRKMHEKLRHLRSKRAGDITRVVILRELGHGG
jgi:hypothetical protein